MSAPAPAKRAPTAYFLFADSVRDAVRADLQGGDAAAKVSVAAVAKGVGERWKALTDEDKAVFKAQAAERAEALRAEAVAAAGAGGGEGGADGPPPADTTADAPAIPGSSLPLSIVRRVMLVDPEVKRVSAGAARAAAAAVEGALAGLAATAAAVAAEAKRRTLRPSDILAAVRRDGRWADAGCVAALAASGVKEVAGGGGGGGRGGGARKRSASLSPRTKKGKRTAVGARAGPARAAEAAAFFAPRGGARAG
jgi:DNA-directed RNA polymerase I subunit RPA43